MTAPGEEPGAGFPHDLPDFADLLDVVAANSPLSSAAMVEKDYWICHTLWALSHSGLRIWFKGGTSLSRAFRITERFSEDLDLVVLPGSAGGLPAVSSWRSETAGAAESRAAYWHALTRGVEVPGAALEWDPSHDETQRQPGYRVVYPGHLTGQLGPPDSVLKPWVLLELAHGDNARCVKAPSVPRPITSFVHDWLEGRGMLGECVDNRPGAVECVHPLVTLLEKLDAITRRYHRADDIFSAAAFARHYEDAARIVLAESTLPPLHCTAAELAQEMLEQKQIRALVRPGDPAFLLPEPGRREMVERGYQALAPMFWGPRIPLDEARGAIIGWLERNPFGEG